MKCAHQVRAHELQELVGDLFVGDFKLGTNVVGLSNLSLVHNGVKCFGHVFAKDKRTLVGAISVQAALFVAADEVDKLGNELLGVLLRAKGVVATRNDERKLERMVVRARKHLPGSLTGSVRVLGRQHVRFVKCTGLLRVFSIDLVGGNVHKELELLACETRHLEQSVGSQRVGASKLNAVAKAIVHVRLGSKMKNRINLVLREEMTQKVSRQDVALDKLKVGSILNAIEVLQKA